MFEEELINVKIEKDFNSVLLEDTQIKTEDVDLDIKMEDFDDNVELYDAIVIKEEVDDSLRTQSLDLSETETTIPEATATKRARKTTSDVSHQKPIVDESTDNLALPSTSETDEEITVLPSTSNKSDKSSVIVSKRIYNTNFCFYCKSFVLNFSRHLKRNHFLELEVKKIFSLPLRSNERKNLLTSLRKKGNYIKNIEKCVRPVKKPNLKNSELLPCTYCLGFYSSKLLFRHRKRCSENTGCKGKNSKSDAQNYLLKNLRVDQQLRDGVFPHMRADRISLVAKKDPLICAFGTTYMKIHRKEHIISVTSRKMRELAKLLIEIMKVQPLVKKFFQALQPQYFDSIIQAAKVVGKYDSVKDIFESPSYALNIGTSLKQCCDVALGYVISKKNNLCSSVYYKEAENNLKDMRELFESNWKFEICGQAVNDLNGEKCNGLKKIKKTEKRKLIPWTDEQTDIVQDYFKVHIQSKKPPKKWECEDLIQQYPEVLHNKCWLKIKVYVQNKYTKRYK